MAASFRVQYAQSGDVSIAYQTIGTGPPDLVMTPGFVSHLEVSWEFPPFRNVIERLASFARVTRFDKRGTGMSDRVSDRELPTLEERADDIRAVMDAVGIDRGFVLGISDGGTMSAYFAATRADRLNGLVLIGTEAHTGTLTSAELAEITDRVRSDWGTEESARRSLRHNAPDRVDDPDWVTWMMRSQRLGASPGAVLALTRMNVELDIRDLLPTIRVPTLVLHRTDDRNVPIEEGRLIAGLIPGAKLVELPGNAHFIFAGDWGALVDEIEEFVTGVRDPEERNRVLATVVFTDIVDSTALALTLGDRGWRELLERHHAIVRRELDRFRGRELDTAGDGFLASFDGPARAVRFARNVVDQLAGLDVAVRAGIHTGECEIHDGKLAGVAVHVGARVSGLASAGEVLVSGTVRDLVAGSGLEFDDRGEHELRGIPERRRIFALRA